MTKEIQNATQQAMILEKALKRATTDKGISFYSLNAELQKAGTSASQLVATLAAGGKDFHSSLMMANTAFAQADRSVLSLNSKIKEMSRVMVQSFKFTAAQTFIQGLTNSVQEAYQWVYDLNKTITDISIVTGYTGDQLTKVTQNAIAGARELRIAANEYAQGALIFYQQGLGDDEVARRTEITAKAAAAAGSSLQDMSSQLTAIWNTYKMVGDEQQRAASVGAKMAADTAVDFADIAEAMQTAAAPAEQMGVSYNSLAAIIATVGDTTQQSASVIGNAFKTIFSRFQQLKSEGTDGEVTLNRVSSQLQELGVNVLDSAGNLRSLDTVIAEVGDQWDSWSSKQQLAIAQLVGGTRQYGQFLTLMNNFDKYQDLLGQANAEDGTALEQQYTASLDSIESHAKNAAESMRSAFGKLFDEDAIKGVYTIIEQTGNIIGTIIDTLGGAPGILALVATTLSSKIVPSLAQGAKNAALLWKSRTTEGRQSIIKDEYNQTDEALKQRKSEAKNSDQYANIDMQQKLNNYGRKTALINEDINTALRTASGVYKINLEYCRELVRTGQELYQKSTLELSAIQDKAKAESELLEVERKRLANQNEILTRRQGELEDKRTDLTGQLVVADEDVAKQKALLDSAKNDSSVPTAALIEQERAYQEALTNREAILKELNKVNEDYDKITQRLSENQKNIADNDFQSALNNAVENMAALSTSTQNADEESNEFAANVGEISNQLSRNLNSALDIAENKINEIFDGDISPEYVQQIEDLRQKIANIDPTNGAAMADLITQIQRLGQEADLSADNIEDITAAAQQAAQGQVTGQQNQDEARRRLQNPDAGDSPTPDGGSGGNQGSGKRDFVAIADGLTQIATGAVTATLSVKGLYDTISNPDSSVLDIFTSLGTTVVTMIPAVQSIQAGIQGLSAAAAAAGMSIGAMLGPILAVAAAAAVVVALFKEFVINRSAEAQLKRQQAALEELTTAEEEAKQAAEDLNSAFDNYSSARDQLAQCVQGTEEWTEALKATNEAALEVVNNLPDDWSAEQIKGAYSRNEETGMIELDDEVIKSAQEELTKEAATAGYAKQIGEISVSQAQQRVDTEDLASDFYSANYDSNSTDNTSSSEFKEIIEKNLDLLGNSISDSDFKKNLEDLGVTVNMTDEELAVLRQKTMELANTSEATAEKMELIAGMKVDELLGNEYSGEVKSIVTDSVAASTEDLEQKYLGALTNGVFGSDEWANKYGNIAQQQTEINKDLLNEYNRLMGTNWKSSGNGVQGTDSQRLFEFIDENGDIKTKTAEAMAAEMAAAKALEDVAGSAENAAQALSMVKTDSENFNNFITNGNFNSMTEGELTSNFGEDMVATEEEAQGYLESVFGGEEELKKAADLMGKSVDELVQEVIDGTEVSASAIENMGDNLTTRAKAIFDEADLSGVEVEAQKNYSLMMEKAFTAGGSEGGEYLNSFVESLQDEAAVAGVEMTDVFDELSGVDWSHITPDQLAEKLESLGISTDSLIDKMPDLIDLMNQAAQVDFSTAQQHFSDLQSFMTMEMGETISQEDYDKISAEGQEYFQLMADGTYQLIGDAREFQNLMKNEAMSQYDQLALDNTQRLGQIEHIQANSDLYNYDELSKSQWGVQIANPFAGIVGPETFGSGSDNDATRRQLEYLEASGWADNNQAQMRDWSEGLENNNLSATEYSAIAEAIRQCGDQTDQWTDKTRQLNEEQKKIEEMQDATRIQGDMQESGLDWNDLSAYREGIEQLIDTQDDAVTGEEEYSDSLLENENVMNEVAKEQARFTQGLQNAADGMEDWKDIWDDNGTIKDYQKFADSMDDMRSAYADLLDVDGSQLSEDFLANAENMELMETVLTGSAEEAAEALNKLQENAILELDLEGLDPATISSYVQSLQDTLSNYGAGIEIPLNETEFYNTLNAMIAACGTDMAAIEALCNNLNIEPLTSEDLIPNEIGADVETDTTTVQSEGKNEATSYDAVEGTPITMDATVTDGSSDIDVGSGTIATVSIPTWDYVPKKETEETTQETPVTSYKLKPGTGVTKTSSNIQKVNHSTPPTTNNYRGGGSKPKSGGGGGGGSAPKHKAKKASKYEPIKDRYATIKSSIDEVQRSVDALSEAEDDAWGGDKVRNMQKINAELQRQGRNLQKLRKLTLDYLDIDQGDAQIAAKDLITNLTEEGLPGLSLDKILFNSDGFVSNRTEITQQLNDYLESLYTPYYEAAMAYDRANSTDEAESERIDELKEKYDTAKAFVDEFLAALDLVDETAQEAADALEQQLENIRTWMANKVEEATYKMEFKIGISDRDISLIEQAIDLWGDLGTKMGKTFDLLGNQLTEETSQFYNTLEHGNRMIEIIENIDPTNPEDAAWFKNEFGEEAWNEYISGNGGLPAEVLEAMQDDADSMIDYMNSMYDTAEEMFGQYIEVLNMYMEEFDKIADKISANNDKLEMFQELLEFSGRRYTSAGRNSIRNIANASVDNAVLEVERAAGALELAEQGAKETSQQLEDFLRDTNKDPSEFDNVEAFTYNQLKAAKDEADQILADAQSDMTSSIQDLASAAADAIEMVAEVIKEEVAANLGGDFASIDDMMTMYDQQYDLDTFFLRDFDKEYQLSSLLGEIEDQMEGITDPERLKEYESLIGEINDANQEGVDLTQTDVDLLKAKFEIQKAQDAYEEAQNAKNTMRLARDASGNWSYVYSADSQNTEDAAQKLADAQYNYEKLLWEASDEASQYWLQAQQDFFQFQETIDWARYEHDKQYRAQIDKQLQYYQEKTELYAAQVTKYNDMLGVSFDETSLGVVTNMQDMESAQDWYTQQHEYYTNELNANTQHYQQVVADACNKVGISYDDLEEVVDDETKLMMQENDALRGTIEKLNIEGGRALSQLNNKVSQFRVKFVEDMKLATKALEDFLAKLEGYESESLDRMNYTGFNAYTDYTAAINNYIGEALQSGMTEEELMSDEGLKKLAYELGNKLNSDMLYELGHTTVKGRWNERTSYDAIDYMAGQIAEVMKKMQQGIWEQWDEVDEWSEQHRDDIQNYGKTASGGLIKTPQVRSLAEDGPELVLNSTDTQNILDAVKHMREVVKLKMSSMNSEIQKKTDGNTQKTIINKDVQQLDQQVHIDATFPNVSVAAEIEEAFNNLVNQAVQYASRK